MLLIDSNRSGDVVITEFSSKDLETHVSNSSDESTSGAFVLFVDVLFGAIFIHKNPSSSLLASEISLSSTIIKYNFCIRSFIVLVYAY